MSSTKDFGKKIKLIAFKRKPAPRWADIKKFGMKRARRRRIKSYVKYWRDGRIKV